MAAAPFIITAPRDIDGWAARFDPASLPVLAETATMLEALRAAEDAVDARLIAETVCADPLLTLKLLAHVPRVRGRRGADLRGDAETVTAALVLLGVGPFFRAFGPQPTVEDTLAGHPGALQGLRAVLRRANRAARFATAFAVHRMDHDVEVIHTAALLHDVTEILLWLHAPVLAGSIAARHAADPALHRANVQRELLHVELTDLHNVLMRRWQLPALLVRISDDRHADSDSVRNVVLAARVARHSENGWDHAALAADVAALAQLLQLSPEPTWTLLRDIDR